MQWRHLRLVRAWGAAGLVIGSSVLAAPHAAAQLNLEVPSQIEITARPADIESQTVDILSARKDGTLDVSVRGQGQDRVKMVLNNRSSKRLNVVIPAGMVAAAGVAQGRGGGGGGGGFQSMGLGAINNRPGGFGQFQPTTQKVAGLRSIPVTASEPATTGIAVPAGESIELTVPAVCLNFGFPTPTPRDTFELKDVDDYTTDARVRKALRSLASYGTSQGVAQAAMWRVCNDVPFEAMAAQGAKVMNVHEIALAARFVEALDSSSGTDLVDPSYFSEGRVFVQVFGEKISSDDLRRVAEQLEGMKLLGLPIRVVSQGEVPTASAPAIFVKVGLESLPTGEIRGQVLASSCREADQWAPLGKTSFRREESIDMLDGVGLAKSLDRALSSAFVSVKTTKRSLNSTTLKVENRLPFTIANVVVKTGDSLGSPSVSFDGIGIGPVRSSLLQIQAAAAAIESVQFNGL